MKATTSQTQIPRKHSQEIELEQSENWDVKIIDFATQDRAGQLKREGLGRRKKMAMLVWNPRARFLRRGLVGKMLEESVF